MMFTMQCRTYETLSPFGFAYAALAAGFAVLICGRLYLTAAGARYAGVD